MNSDSQIDSVSSTAILLEIPQDRPQLLESTLNIMQKFMGIRGISISVVDENGVLDKGSKLSNAHAIGVHIKYYDPKPILNELDYSHFPSPLDFFTGRSDNLIEISQAFGPSSSQVSVVVYEDDNVGVQALHGAGGIGKTQLILKYASKNKERYNYFAFIECEDLDKSYRRFAEKLLKESVDSIPLQDVSEKVHAHIRKMENKKILIVFDNAESPQQLAALLKYDDIKNAHVLISSRHTQWGSYRKILVKEFKPYQSFNYLCKRIHANHAVPVMVTQGETSEEKHAILMKRKTIPFLVVLTEEELRIEFISKSNPGSLNHISIIDNTTSDWQYLQSSIIEEMDSAEQKLISLSILKIIEHKLKNTDENFALKKIRHTVEFLKKLQEMTRLLGHYPLVLSQAAAWLSENNFEVSEYINCFNNTLAKRKDLINNQPILNEPHHKNILASFETSLEFITKDKTLHEIQRIHKVLYMIAVLYPDHIQKEIFYPDFHEIIKILSNYSLIYEVNHKYREGVKEYRIHRVLQDVIRISFADKDKTEVMLYWSHTFFKECCDILSSPGMFDYEKSTEKTFPSSVKYLVHAEHAMKIFLDELRYNCTQNLLSIFDLELKISAMYLYYYRDRTLAKKFIDHVIDYTGKLIKKPQNELKNEEKGLLYFRGVALGQRAILRTHSSGDYSEAENDISESLSLYYEYYQFSNLCNNEGDSGYAFCLGTLANIRLKYYDYDYCLDLYKKAVDLKVVKYGQESFAVACSQQGVAAVDRIRGNYQEALTLLQTCLAIKEKTCGIEHNSYMMALDEIGHCYYYQGDHDAALKKYSQAYEIKTANLKNPKNAEKQNAQDNYEKNRSLLFIAQCYMMKNKSKEAMNNLDKISKNDTPQLANLEKAMFFNVKAYCYLLNRNFNEAFNYTEKAHACLPAGNIYSLDILDTETEIIKTMLSLKLDGNFSEKAQWIHEKSERFFEKIYQILVRNSFAKQVKDKIDKLFSNNALPISPSQSQSRSVP